MNLIQGSAPGGGLLYKVSNPINFVCNVIQIIFQHYIALQTYNNIFKMCL